MNLDKYLENYNSPIQSSLATIPVPFTKPTTHKCVSCGEDTPFLNGYETYDTVSQRRQFFCRDCYNTSNAVIRSNRKN